VKRSLRCGQSITELALLFPVMLAILCGIIDFGYYTFAYATVESAARRGSEQAMKAPPPPNTDGSVTDDYCVAAIRSAARVGTAPLVFANSDIVVKYPTASDQSLYSATPTRAVGSVIQVQIVYTDTWLSPLGPLFFLSNTFTIRYTSRRSIVNPYYGTYCASGS
jgi:Flp pilus assembly protein TadG